jgi:type II secretory pathway component PulF
MPTFSFTARDAAGRWHNGTQIAESTGDLAGVIRARGWALVKAEATADAGNADDTSKKSRGRGIRPARSLDVELGLRMLSTMLEGGLTLLASLKTCADQAAKPRMAGIWDDIHDRIAGGTSFGDAMSNHRVFAKLVVQLTHAGEQSGFLERVLEQAADQLERKRELFVTVFSALMYPIFTATVAIGVGAYLTISVIPEIAKFLQAGNHRLPAITQALLSTSAFINEYLLPIGIGIGSFVVAVILGYRYRPTAIVMDHILLRIPIVGKIFRLAGTTLFARGLGMLLEAGVPMITALDTSGNMLKNRALSTRVQKAKASVLGGNSLHRPLGAGGEFLPMLTRMIAVGEETGTLSEVLIKVANFHDKQLESYVKRMTLLIEPVMTVIVGFMVGFVYLAFFMAIYSITSA